MEGKVRKLKERKSGDVKGGLRKEMKDGKG